MKQECTNTTQISRREKANDPLSSPVQTYLEQLHEIFAKNNDGAIADYIPELTKADPDWFGITVVTVDGHVYQVGDTRQPFTMQSVSKALTYGLALEDNGTDAVLEKIGVEPSGDAFNSISLDPETGRPLNPMINAGAITATSLVHGDDLQHRLQRILDKFAIFVGHPVHVNEKVYQSESSSGHRNRAIGYMLRNFDIIQKDLDDTLELYFQQCSIEVTCRDLALAAGTLANGGINPITGVIALKNEYVSNVLSVMTTCGMYDYAGSWIYEIGMPAKSGVGGGILAVLPGQLGIGVFSPRLDLHGNSVRGIEVCRRLAKDYGLHIFNPARVTPSVIRANYDLQCIRSKRIRSSEDKNILERDGASTLVLDLHGDLMFGTTEIVVAEVTKVAETKEIFVLDLQRVFSIDLASMKLFSKLCQTLIELGKHLFFVNTKQNFAFSRFMKRALDPAQDPDVLFFKTKDEAIEWCEEQILSKAGRIEANASVSLMSQSLLRGMSEDEIKYISKLTEKKTYQPGAAIFSANEPANKIYFIHSGEVSIDLSIRRNHTRLAQLGPGMFFGELAFVENGTRTANARAKTEVTCFELSRERFENDLPTEIRYKLLMNVCDQLAQNLRTANKEITALL